MDDPTGGPAFPTSPNSSDPAWAAARDGGFSRLDYIAIHAMSAMLVGCVGVIGDRTEITAYAKGHCNKAVVDRAYTIAEQMLAESNHRAASKP